MTIEVDEYGLRRGLKPRPMPSGPSSIAALVDGLPSMDAPAIIDRYGTLTYAQLVSRTRAAIAWFRTMGIGPGKIVAASAPNSAEIVIAFLAVQRLGGMWVGINPALAPPEKAAQLRDNGAQFFLGSPQMVSQIEGERGALPELHTILTIDSQESEYAHVIRAPDPPPIIDLPLPDALAPAVFGYTSGTTGVPKGVVHSQHSMMVFANGCIASNRRGQWMRGARRGISITVTIPNLMAYGPLVSLTAAGTCVLMDRIDAEGVGEWIQEHRVEIFNGTPTTFRDLLLKPELQYLDLSSLKGVTTGGGPVPDDLIDAFRERFGFELMADYGLSESPASVSSNALDEPTRTGVVGKPYPHLQVAIMDPEGKPLPQGSTGELCIAAAASGPWQGVYTGMLGYWRKPDETRAAFFGPWLRTGDQAMLDEQGRLVIVGRKKEMILRGGANIFPAEVEAVLRQHPHLHDVVVMGLPDARLGEIVVAYLKLKPGIASSAELREALRGHCASRIARYKIPERWFVVDDFPRNALNKPLRQELPKVPNVELRGS